MKNKDALISLANLKKALGEQEIDTPVEIIISIREFESGVFPIITAKFVFSPVAQEASRDALASLLSEVFPFEEIRSEGESQLIINLGGDRNTKLKIRINALQSGHKIVLRIQCIQKHASMEKFVLVVRKYLPSIKSLSLKLQPSDQEEK